jgi:streptogramin lyase
VSYHRLGNRQVRNPANSGARFLQRNDATRYQMIHRIYHAWGMHRRSTTSVLVVLLACSLLLGCAKTTPTIPTNSIIKLVAPKITEYLLPTADSLPYAIAAGPDGALWFTEAGTNRIGRITLAGALTEFALPQNGPGASHPYGITVGPDGALWFEQADALVGLYIGRITTTGALTRFAIDENPPPVWVHGAPGHITAGPDGALWFTAGADNLIGRVSRRGAQSGAVWTAAAGAGRLSGRAATHPLCARAKLVMEHLKQVFAAP